MATSDISYISDRDLQDVLPAVAEYDLKRRLYMKICVAMLLMLLVSCVTETSIIKNINNDTDVIGDTNNSVNETNVINNNVTGLFEMGLRQVACPACVGVSEELTLKMRAEFHQQSTVGHFE